MDQEAVTQNDIPIEVDLEQPTTTITQDNTAPPNKSDLDENDLTELNFKKQELKRLKDECGTWINKITTKIDCDSLPKLDQEKLDLIKDVQEKFDQDSQQNEDSIKDKNDFLQLFLPIIERSTQSFSDLGAELKELLNKEFGLDFKIESCMRLIELLAKREETKDVSDKSVHWWEIKSLEKLKEVDGLTEFTDDCLLTRKSKNVIKQLNLYIKSIEKVQKTLKKKDQEFVRKKLTEFEKSKNRMEVETKRLEKKKQANKERREKQDKKRVKINDDAQSKKSGMKNDGENSNTFSNIGGTSQLNADDFNKLPNDAINGNNDITMTNQSKANNKRAATSRAKKTGIKKTGKTEPMKESNAMVNELTCNGANDTIQDNQKDCDGNLVSEDIDGIEKKVSTDKEIGKKSMNGKNPAPVKKPINNMLLTNFFMKREVPKTETTNASNILISDELDKNNKMEEEEIPDKKNEVQDKLFKRCLGCLNLGNEWDINRKTIFDETTKWLYSSVGNQEQSQASSNCQLLGIGPNNFDQNILLNDMILNMRAKKKAINNRQVRYCEKYVKKNQFMILGNQGLTNNTIANMEIVNNSNNNNTLLVSNISGQNPANGVTGPINELENLDNNTKNINLGKASQQEKSQKPIAENKNWLNVNNQTEYLEDVIAITNKTNENNGLTGEANTINNHKIKIARYLLIRSEDYLNDFYQSAGLFKKSSLIINAKNPFKHDENVIDYAMSSDEELQLEEAESIGDTGKNDDDEDSDIDEGDNFVVPDGYFSDSEVQSMDDGEKNIVRTKNDGKSTASTSNNKPFIMDFKNYMKGSDVNIDSMLAAFTILNIDEDETPYPININRDITEIEVFEKEVIIDIIRNLHGKDSKKTVIEEMRDTYPAFSKAQLKKKIEEISCWGCFVNYDLFEKVNLADDAYYQCLEKLFADDKNGGKKLGRDDSDNDSQDRNLLGGIQQSNEKFGVAKIEESNEKKTTAQMIQQRSSSKFEGTTDAVITEQKNIEGEGKVVVNKRQKKINAINDEELLKQQIMKCHGFDKGMSGKNTAFIAEITLKFSDCSKAMIEKKAREITKTGYIVNRDLFIEYGIENEFIQLLQKRFDKKEDTVSDKSSISKESLMGDLNIDNQKPINQENLNALSEIKEATVEEEIKTDEQAGGLPTKQKSQTKLTDIFGKINLQDK